MIYQQVLDVFEQLDRPDASGELIKRFFHSRGYSNINIETVNGDKGSTDFVKIVIPGERGKTNGGNAPTLGIVGRLGGLGARPSVQGFVSDGDGALAVLAAALKMLMMSRNGDTMAGDVIVTTQIDPHAPTLPHDPVPFMGSSVNMDIMNKYEVLPEMDAIISVDTTKGNRILNKTGISITPTIKEGYILRVSEDLLDVLQIVTGELPYVLPITIQDITPYGNEVYHINSIMQPCVATDVPVVGLAITSTVTVPGCSTGASRLNEIEHAGRFCIEVAKLFGQRKASFHSESEYQHLLGLYGPLKQFQTNGVVQK